MGKSEREMVEVVKENLGEGVWTREMVEEKIGGSVLDIIGDVGEHEAVLE